MLMRMLWALLAANSVGLAQQYAISTFAGGGEPATPSVAVEAAIGLPIGIATDEAGNAYFSTPELNSVFKLGPNGTLSRIAGGSRPGYSGHGGPATSARLNSPSGLAVDGAGNLFIVDSGNHSIRKVLPNGLIVTVAGDGAAGFSGDGGPATSARLNRPAGVAVDGAGNLFIADRGNYRIRKVSTSGIMTTVAGSGECCVSGDGGPATSAALVAVAVAVDREGNVFVADSLHVRKVTVDGIITTVAGSGTQGFSGDGGPATSAEVRAWGVAVDGAGNLFIATLCAIRKVAAGGTITTVAGSCLAGGFSGDGGPATSARLSGAFQVAVDRAGNLSIADAGNGRIRRVSPEGIITTVAGNGGGSPNRATGDGGPAIGAQLRFPTSVAADRAGNVFIADTYNHRIRRVSPEGTVTTVAGTGIQGTARDDGPALDAQLSVPGALALDGAGNLFFADSNGTRVRKVSPGGMLTTVAGALSGSVRGVAVDGGGNVFLAEYDRIRKVSADGTITTVAGGGSELGDGGPATKATLYPMGMVVDSAGNLLIADEGHRRIRKVSPAGIITTVSGSGAFEGPSGDGGPATSARLSAPAALALDSAGNLFLADPGSDFLTGGETGLQTCCDYRIRKIATDGTITTVAGIGMPGYSGDGGLASAAALGGPLGVAVDGGGNVYIADSVNGVVRVLRPTGRSLLIGAVVDAANPQAGLISPGKIVVLYGAGLGPAEPIENRASNGALGTELSGTTVSFNGIAAPILYTSATQIAAVVPYGIAGTTTRVVATYQGQASNELLVATAASAPSLFTVSQDGSGQAAAVNAADGSVNSAANPVVPGGDLAFFATGEGQTAPGGQDGRLGGSTPTRAVLAVSVTVGGVPARIEFAGGVEGKVAGLMQVKVRIPAGAAPGGYVPVILQVGDGASSPAVWIAVSEKR